MTPLTDEELAALETEYRMYRHYASSRDVPRLIADLRAARAEVDRLTIKVGKLESLLEASPKFSYDHGIGHGMFRDGS